MRNPLAYIKTLVLLSAIAFAGHALATPDYWFKGIASSGTLTAENATWTTNVLGDVTVNGDALEIDLPTNTVVKLTPNSAETSTGKKTTVVVDNAMFTPTYTNDIDNTVVDGAQTALTVAYDDSEPVATNYYAYIGGDWIKLDGATPNGEAVDVTVELDYSNSAVTNAAFKIGDNYLHSAADGTTWQFPISGEHGYLDRVELAGYGSIHSITSTVEQAVNVIVTPGTVTYGADFTNVTITAYVEGDGYTTAEYTLTWGGSSAGTFTRDGNTITITAPIDSQVRESVGYVINVNGNVATNQTVVVADNRDWIIEDSGNKNRTGTWNPITYDDTVATVSDTSTYEASSCTTGDLVTITFENLVYTELSDLSVPTPSGTQGAFALAETNINETVSTNFMILAKPVADGPYVWMKAEWAGGTPSMNASYTVEMVFNYTNNTYSVKVNGGSLSVNLETEFQICVTSTKVSALEFRGSGTLTGIKGVDTIGYMAKGNNGGWYKTIDDALNSGYNGPFTILYPTGVTSAPGWTFETVDGVTTFFKNLVKGVFFMVY